MENTFLHKTSAIKAQLNSLENKNSSLSNNISILGEEIQSYFQENSEKFLASVSEHNEKINKQYEILLTNINNDFRKTNDLFSTTIYDSINELNEKLKHFLNGVSGEIQINLRRDLHQIRRDGNQDKKLFNNKLNTINSKNSIILNQLYNLELILDTVQVDLFPELKNQLDTLNKSMAKRDQVQNIFDQLLQVNNENNNAISGALEKNHQENIVLVNKSQKEAFNLITQLNSQLEEIANGISPSILQEIQPKLDEIGEAKDTKKFIAEHANVLNDSITTQLNNLSQLNEDLQKSTIETVNAALAELQSLIDNNFVDFNDTSKQRLKQLTSELESALETKSNQIIREIGETTKGFVAKHTNDLNGSITTQLNNLSQVNKELQKSTLETVNAALAELESLIDNNFVDFNDTSKQRLKQLTSELESALETKAKRIISEIGETTASEQMMKAMHDQLLLEVNSFKEDYNKIEKYIEDRSTMLQGAVLETNDSIIKFEDFLVDKNNKLQHSIFESNGSIKKIEDYLEETSGQFQNNAFESNIIIKKIDELGAGLENTKETKLLKKFITSEFYANYERLDSLFSIHGLLNINSPLPVMHEWRISSDFATHLIGAILKKGKGNVIDIGSGVSTILAGYALKKNGKGKVIALEHSKEYYNKTLALIKEHNLNDYCNLYLCPLKKYTLNKKEWLWYDITEVKLPSNIILINVDGPPGDTQPMARYPAIPILNDIISKDTVILLDDGKREDEKKIADAWEEELNLNKEFIKNYKGLYELTK